MKECGWTLDAENDSQVIANKVMRSSIYNCMELNSANNLYKAWKWILLQGLLIRIQASQHFGSGLAGL